MAKLDNEFLKTIKDLMEVTVEEAIERKRLVTRNHPGNLPRKDELYGRMDEVMRELKAIREEQAAQGDQLSDPGNRIERIGSRMRIASD